MKFVFYLKISKFSYALIHPLRILLSVTFKEGQFPRLRSKFSRLHNFAICVEKYRPII